MRAEMESKVLWKVRGSDWFFFADSTLRRKFKHAYWPQALHIQTKECNIP